MSVDTTGTSVKALKGNATFNDTGAAGTTGSEVTVDRLGLGLKYFLLVSLNFP